MIKAICIILVKYKKVSLPKKQITKEILKVKLFCKR